MISFLKPTSLNKKLLLVSLTGVFFLVIAFGSLRVYQEQQNFKEDIAIAGQGKVDLIAKSVSSLLVGYDYSNLELLSERIIGIKDVNYIEIRNRNGKTMVNRKSPSYDPEATDSATFHSDVYFDDTKVGSVVLNYSYNRLKDQLNKTYKTIFLAVIIFSLLIGSSIYLTVSHMIVKPVLMISNAAHELAMGNFDAALPKYTKDEIGKLAYAFDTMREKRQQTENELNELNHTLEEKVELRVVQLKDKEFYIQSILDNLTEGIMVTDGEGNILSCNHSALKIFKYSEDELLQMEFGKLMTMSNASVIGENETEVTGVRKDKSTFPLEMKLNQIIIQGQLLTLISCRDITQRKQIQDKINHMATHDALTGLPNRNLLHGHILQSLSHSRRQKMRTGLLFIDLDKFKIINDTLGHDYGDLLLKEVSVRLLSCVRDEDVVSRHGGDEFVVLLTSMPSKESAGVVAQKIIESVVAPYHIRGKKLNISASIGISIFHDDGDNMEDLMKKADTAMYVAKQSGRNQYKFYSEINN